MAMGETLTKIIRESALRNLSLISFAHCQSKIKVLAGDGNEASWLGKPAESRSEQ